MAKMPAFMNFYLCRYDRKAEAAKLEHFEYQCAECNESLLGYDHACPSKKTPS